MFHKYKTAARVPNTVPLHDSIQSTSHSEEKDGERRFLSFLEAPPPYISMARTDLNADTDKESEAPLTYTKASKLLDSKGPSVAFREIPTSNSEEISSEEGGVGNPTLQYPIGTKQEIGRRRQAAWQLWSADKWVAGPSKASSS